MHFTEIHSYLLSNHKVRRKGWEDKSMYLMIDNNDYIKFYRTLFTEFMFDVSTVLSDGWEIIGEPDQKFLFKDIIIPLQNGKKARHETWHEDIYIEREKNTNHLFKTSIEEFFFAPTFDDLTQNDWEAIDDEVHRELIIDGDKVTGLI